MRPFVSLSKAMALGFVRDRTALFFTLFFPLMFLVLFGGIFANQSQPKTDILQIGPVTVLDQMPAAAKAQLDAVLSVTAAQDREAALEKVRKGEADAAVEQRGDQVVLHYSATDQVQAGTVIGLFSSIVDNGNLAVAGVTSPAFNLSPQKVEDESLKAIQYVTPGLLGWAVATAGTFGAALTLSTWRQKKILRRLRLAPVSTTSVIGARVGVSVAVALAQMAIFIGVASLPYFGLQLSDAWWMAIPLLVAGTLAFLALGFLAGAATKTPESATAVANLVVLPMAFLSGAFFPLEFAPAWLRTISQALPMRHLVDGMLAVMVRGQAPTSVLPQLGILLAFAVVVTVIARLMFRWDDD
jgi:ABC-2 type transport system permease protein